ASLQGTSAITVARQLGGRQRHGHGATFWAREYTVSTGGWEAEHRRRENPTRRSVISTAGMQTVTAKSLGARASGSPWGCSPSSSLPLCGSAMTVSDHTCTVLSGS